MSVPDWLIEMFGEAISDARAKLLDEGFFGRRVPEQQGRSDLGWFQDHSSAEEPAVHAPEQDHNPNPHELDRGMDR